jgi:flagellar basal-body rod protein FlgC
MFSALDISTSALVAQRVRLNAIAGNIANMSTTHDETGRAAPYQARFTVFRADDKIGGQDGGAGVRVDSIQTSKAEPRWRYQPGHPDAVKTGERAGWVAYPNIDMTTEFVDALEATRAYEANIGVIETTKSMNQQALRIVA